MRLSILGPLVCLLLSFSAFAAPGGKPIPEPLKAWESWVTWDDQDRFCPTPFNDPKKHFCFWPSRLTLRIERGAGHFEINITVYSETWVPLPGEPEIWPLEVKANGVAQPVVEHDGRPCVRLAAGAWRIEGLYRWTDFPQRISVPREIGILSLAIDGKTVDAPVWDAESFLWLKRDGSTEEANKDFLAVKVYAVIEDGIPLWRRAEIELTVSGKSREEEIGAILPAGWRLASVEGPIPVAVDDAGTMKAQVRAGKWTVTASAFRFDNPKEFAYAPGVKPAVAEELVAFRSRPDFRMVEIAGAAPIDVSQTTFPDKWRELPVYRWETGTAFRIEERLRGMGDQKPAGLTISREWWLDENGRALTFRDIITGQMQQIWRLDAAPGQDLGSVRSGGQGQLITRNPQNAAPGVEIRTRNLQFEATGRIPRAPDLSATGWRSDADSLRVTLNLPPGWRLFALFGADWVQGDWLTAWSLLDLFLLLVFSLAVFRLWGIGPAVLAFGAFVISYHEPGAPRFIWLLLLIPLALLRVVPENRGRRWLVMLKWCSLAVFVLILAPFVAGQVEQALYPQLETVHSPGRLLARRSAEMLEYNAPQAPLARADGESSNEYRWSLASSAVKKGSAQIGDNLLYDAKTRIQTGPGVPEWKWRTVSFGWNGPVLAGQQVHPVLISLATERVLTLARILLVLALAAVLLKASRASKAAALILLTLFFGMAAPVSAQSPDQQTLEKLRERLLEPSDAYPAAADIPNVSLKLSNQQIVIEAEIHAAIQTAVPFPGSLPAWSPVAVLVDGKAEAALRREDGYLWVVLPAGVHRVRIEGRLADATEWEWTFQLKPRRVAIEAPDWTFTGVRPDGVPEQQIFFARKQKAAAGAASYDRQDLQTAAAIDRHLELGLLWQVRTTVTRLSPPGKAIALRVPLLPGENVLSSNAVVKEGFIELRLSAQEQTFTWESGLAVTEHIHLATRADDAWVERWHLVASPVWNVAISGLPPVFEADAAAPAASNRTISAGRGDLIPTWQPWPGESVDLAISRPEAIAGATVTASRATHEITLGKRQRVSQLELSLRCSVGEDFLIDLPAAADITSLMHNGKPMPVRKDGSRLIIPLRPGEQAVTIGWKINTPLGLRASAEAVRLPVESANLNTVITVPEDRWVLWANGPRRGPAVRFWVILACSLLAALALGGIRLSPLRHLEWMLLAIGLTQVPLPAALAVAGWLFFLAWRGDDSFQKLGGRTYNALQVALILLTAIALGVLLTAVGEGLLGNPEMFITGNSSSRTVLRWFQARSEGLLPQPGCVSISIWWYRLLMLAWALWLAAALIRWLRLGWENFTRGGFFRRSSKSESAPPPLPV